MSICHTPATQFVLISTQKESPPLLQARVPTRMLSNRAYLRVRAHYSGGLRSSPPSLYRTHKPVCAPLLVLSLT